MTTHGSASNAATFYEDLIRRDARCVVSGTEVPVSASHLIPKCIGSDGARDIVERYVGATEATGIHQFDPRIGITLLKSVGHWVTLFQAGFYHITVSRRMQLFIVLLNIAWHITIFIPSTISTLSILGLPPNPSHLVHCPELHGYPVTL